MTKKQWYKYNTEQIDLIKKGMEQNLDISKYCSPEFSTGQMETILWGLEQNLNVTIYAKPELTEDQMETIMFMLISEQKEQQK